MGKNSARISMLFAMKQLLPRLGDQHCEEVKRCGDKKTGKQACLLSGLKIPASA
jgi:hypothetical protein